MHIDDDSLSSDESDTISEMSRDSNSVISTAFAPEYRPSNVRPYNTLRSKYNDNNVNDSNKSADNEPPVQNSSNQSDERSRSKSTVSMHDSRERRGSWLDPGNTLVSNMLDVAKQRESHAGSDDDEWDS
jgi:hypothetical protein